MKFFSIITAILVCTVLYFAILDRDTLVNFAAQFVPEPTAEETADAAPEEADPTLVAQEPATADGAVQVVARRSLAQDAENAILLRGRTEAVRQVMVSAETMGRIISQPLRAGASVTEGELMCEIDPGTSATALAEAEARLLEARARLPEAEAQLPVARARQTEAEAALVAAEIDSNAASRLSESGFASETRAASAAATVSTAEAAITSAAAGVQAAEAGIESALSGIRAAEAAVIRAEQEIERLTIYAPFSGLLETDTAEFGSLMQPGSLCGTIIQLNPMKLVGFVPEAQVDRVTVGANAGARLATGAEVQGRVTFISRSADPQTRTFRVEITVENADLTIRDGQSADILIQTAGNSAHLLPASAMTLNDDGALGVRIVVDDVARFHPVQMIRDTERGVWLTGLPEAADVIVVGQEFVTDGVPVRVTYEELMQ